MLPALTAVFSGCRCFAPCGLIHWMNSNIRTMFVYNRYSAQNWIANPYFVSCFYDRCNYAEFGYVSFSDIPAMTSVRTSCTNHIQNGCHNHRRLSLLPWGLLLKASQLPSDSFNKSATFMLVLLTNLCSNGNFCSQAHSRPSRYYSWLSHCWCSCKTV